MKNICVLRRIEKLVVSDFGLDCVLSLEQGPFYVEIYFT